MVGWGCLPHVAGLLAAYYHWREIFLFPQAEKCGEEGFGNALSCEKASTVYSCGLNGHQQCQSMRGGRVEGGTILFVIFFFS